jgi:hypothetical protein
MATDKSDSAQGWGKEKKKRERQSSLSAGGDSSQKKGQKLKFPLIVYI